MIGESQFLKGVEHGMQLSDARAVLAVDQALYWYGFFCAAFLRGCWVAAYGARGRA